MQPAKQQKIKPVAFLYEVRKAVSEILNKPFSERVDHQIFKPDQKVLSLWAAECAEHVLPCFEEECPMMTDREKPLRLAERGRTPASFGCL